jgi:hypothetical protein
LIVKRFSAAILILTFLALGSGAMEYLHNLQHSHEDAALAAEARRAADPRSKTPVHDDSNCEVHRQLHLPAISVGWVPLLVFAGIFVAFLSEIAQALVSRAPIFRLDCRGPPACS